jgi:hypothetical protein
MAVLADACDEVAELITELVVSSRNATLPLFSISLARLFNVQTFTNAASPSGRALLELLERACTGDWRNHHEFGLLLQPFADRVLSLHTTHMRHHQPHSFDVLYERQLWTVDDPPQPAQLVYCWRPATIAAGRSAFDSISSLLVDMPRPSLVQQ